MYHQEVCYNHQKVISNLIANEYSILNVYVIHFQLQIIIFIVYVILFIVIFRNYSIIPFTMQFACSYNLCFTLNCWQIPYYYNIVLHY